MSQSTPPPPTTIESRADQITFRFVLKLIGVLVEGRLGSGGLSSGGGDGNGDKKDLRIDKWFNLPLPEPDLLRPSLHPYRFVSTSYPLYTSSPSSPSSQPQSERNGLEREGETEVAASGGGGGDESGSSSFTSVRAGSSKPSSGSGSGSEVRVRRVGLGVDGEEGIPSSKTVHHPTRTMPTEALRNPILKVNSNPDTTSPNAVGFTSLPPLLIAFILDLSTLNEEEEVLVLEVGDDEDTIDVEGRDNGGARRGNRWRKVDLGVEGMQADQRTRSKGKQKAGNIVLETWTLRTLPLPPPSSSSARADLQPQGETQPISASTAYRNGIEGILAINEKLRELPLERLSSKLRRKGGGTGGVDGGGLGVKLGIKVWAASGWEEDWSLGRGRGIGGEEREDSKLEKAWVEMEEGLIGMKEPFSIVSESAQDRQASSSSTPSPARKGEIKTHTFPTVQMPNTLFSLTVESRLDLEKLHIIPKLEFITGPTPSANPQPNSAMDLDVQEEYFTPTLLRKRRSVEIVGGLSRGAPRSGGPAGTGNQPASLPSTGMQYPTPGNGNGIGFAPPMRAGLSATRPVIMGTGTSGTPPPADLVRQGEGSRIGSEGVGLPFAVSGEQTGRQSTPPSSSPVLVGSQSTRRRSSLGMRSTTAQDILSGSPSSQIQGGRSSPLAMQPPIGSYGSGRPSSLLSQSGRSYTQLNPLNDSRPRLQSLLTSPEMARQSPIPTQMLNNTGSYRGIPGPLSPSGSSLPKPFGTPPIAAGRSGFVGSYSSSPTPPIPETPEGEAGMASGSFTGPQSMKRYSSSFGQRQRTGSFVGSPADSGSLRRSVGRGSSEGLIASGGGAGTRQESGSGTGSGSANRPTQLSQIESEDISDFLRLLDSTPAPPTIMAMSAIQPRPVNRSTSSSIIPSRTPSSPASPRDFVAGGIGSPYLSPTAPPGSASLMMRKPLTKSQVGDTLRRMADSYIGASGQPFPQPQTGSPRSLSGGSGSVVSNAVVGIARTPSFGARRPVSGNATGSTIRTVSNLSNNANRNVLPAPTSPSPPNPTPTPSFTGLPAQPSLPSAMAKESPPLLGARTTSSSVKSSSPLAGAPILAGQLPSRKGKDRESSESSAESEGEGKQPPMAQRSANLAGIAGTEGEEDHIAGSGPTTQRIHQVNVISTVMPNSSATTAPMTRTVQSLPGPSTNSPALAIGLNTFSSAAVASPSDDLLSPVSTSASASPRTRQPRTPVLLRGGFGERTVSSSAGREYPLDGFSAEGQGQPRSRSTVSSMSPRMSPIVNTGGGVPGLESPVTYSLALPGDGPMGLVRRASGYADETRYSDSGGMSGEIGGRSRSQNGGSNSPAYPSMRQENHSYRATSSPSHPQPLSSLQATALPSTFWRPTAPTSGRSDQMTGIPHGMRVGTSDNGYNITAMTAPDVGSSHVRTISREDPTDDQDIEGDEVLGRMEMSDRG